MTSSVGIEEVLSPSVLKRAAAKVRREIRLGWVENGTHILSADDQLHHAGLEINGALRWFIDDKGRRRGCRVRRAVIPKRWLDGESGFLNLVQSLADPRTPEPAVIESQLPSEREIHLYGLASRVLHRGVADRAMAALQREGFFADSSHGYMPKRGRFTALEAVRAAQRTARYWAMSFDIARCFTSISTKLLARALKEHCPSSPRNSKSWPFERSRPHAFGVRAIVLGAAVRSLRRTRSP